MRNLGLIKPSRTMRRRVAPQAQLGLTVVDFKVGDSNLTRFENFQSAEREALQHADFNTMMKAFPRDEVKELRRALRAHWRPRHPLLARSRG